MSESYRCRYREARPDYPPATCTGNMILRRRGVASTGGVLYSAYCLACGRVDTKWNDITMDMCIQRGIHPLCLLAVARGAEVPIWWTGPVRLAAFLAFCEEQEAKEEARNVRRMIDDIDDIEESEAA